MSGFHTAGPAAAVPPTSVSVFRMKLKREMGVVPRLITRTCRRGHKNICKEIGFRKDVKGRGHGITMTVF